MMSIPFAFVLSTFFIATVLPVRIDSALKTWAYVPSPIILLILYYPSNELI